jgi:hypothetical protein
MESSDRSEAIDWGHFAGMLALMASTASFWLLVYRFAKRTRPGE